MLNKLDDTKKLILGAAALVVVFALGNAIFGSNEASVTEAKMRRAEALVMQKSKKLKILEKITLDQVKEIFKTRLRRLEAMSDERYERISGKHKQLPAKRQEMVSKMRGQLNALETMSEAEWETERSRIIENARMGKGLKMGMMLDNLSRSEDEAKAKEKDAKSTKEEKKTDAKEEKKKTEEKKKPSLDEEEAE